MEAFFHLIPRITLADLLHAFLNQPFQVCSPQTHQRHFVWALCQTVTRHKFQELCKMLSLVCQDVREQWQKKSIVKKKNKMCRYTGSLYRRCWPEKSDIYLVKMHQCLLLIWKENVCVSHVRMSTLDVASFTSLIRICGDLCGVCDTQKKWKSTAAFLGTVKK